MASKSARQYGPHEVLEALPRLRDYLDDCTDNKEPHEYVDLIEQYVYNHKNQEAIASVWKGRALTAETRLYWVPRKYSEAMVPKINELREHCAALSEEGIDSWTSADEAEVLFDELYDVLNCSPSLTDNELPIVTDKVEEPEKPKEYKIIHLETPQSTPARRTFLLLTFLPMVLLNAILAFTWSIRELWDTFKTRWKHPKTENQNED